MIETGTTVTLSVIKTCAEGNDRLDKWADTDRILLDVSIIIETACVDRIDFDTSKMLFTKGNGSPSDGENVSAPEATQRCPTDAIVWVEGAQFGDIAAPASRSVEPSAGRSVEGSALR